MKQERHRFRCPKCKIVMKRLYISGDNATKLAVGWLCLKCKAVVID